MAFLCLDFDVCSNDAVFTVKQSERSGTYLHKRQGITELFRGKTPKYVPVFCERNGYRIVIGVVILRVGEQMTACTVFIYKTVTKYFSISGYGCSNV
jgi:hypothetical protein